MARKTKDHLIRLRDEIYMAVVKKKAAEGRVESTNYYVEHLLADIAREFLDPETSTEIKAGKAGKIIMKPEATQRVEIEFDTQLYNGMTIYAQLKGWKYGWENRLVTAACRYFLANLGQIEEDEAKKVAELFKQALQDLQKKKRG